MFSFTHVVITRRSGKTSPPHKLCDTVEPFIVNKQTSTNKQTNFHTEEQADTGI